MTSESLQPLVSVGMPVYNCAEKTLRRAIDSVLSQDYLNFELIISDNGTTDDTGSICLALAKQDPRIAYIRQPRNLGPNWNFNHVVSLAKGKYFMRMSHDDVRATTYLTKCVASLEADSEAVLSHSYTAAFYGDLSNVACIQTFDTLIGVQNPRKRFMRAMKQLPATAFDGVFRTETLLRKTRLLQSYLSSDVVLTSEIALHGAFVQVPEVLFWRSGKSILPSPQEVYRWLGQDTPLSRLKRPFVVLLLNHLRSVRRSPLTLLEQVALSLQIIAHVCKNTLVKMGFRSIIAVMGEKCPAWILRMMIARSSNNPNIRMLKPPLDLPPALHPTWRFLDHRNLDKAIALQRKLDAKLFSS